MLRILREKKRLLLLLLLFVFLFFSILQNGFAPPHDCAGEQCEICILLSEIRGMQEITLPPSGLTFTALFLLLTLVSLRMHENGGARETLISLRVKLSD